MFPKNKKVHSLYLYYNATGPFIWKTPYLKYLKFSKNYSVDVIRGFFSLKTSFISLMLCPL